MVEAVDGAASLYGLGLGGKHICLLAKHQVRALRVFVVLLTLRSQGKGVAVDGKSNDSVFLGHVLAELKAAVQEA